MKPICSLPLLALLGAACQQQPAQQAAANMPVKAAVVATAAPTKAAAAPVAAAPKQELTPDMQKFLQQHDLSPLWRTVEAADGAADIVHNGFFGENHYRIEVVFASVKQDANDPARFHVVGKNRYKNTITPFTGVIQIEQLLDQQGENDGAPLAAAAGYVALGKFSFAEQSPENVRSDGTFSGAVALDFQLDEQSKLQRDYSLGGKYGALGSGYLFKGKWVNTSTGAVKPVLFADNFLGASKGVLEDFAIGERDVFVNPKYAKLGWDNYWKNDEWWAEPGAPATAQLSATDSL